MTKNYIFGFLALMLVVGFSSCRTSRFIYTAPKPNVPFFKEKGDAKIGGAFGDDGVDVQAAYAVSDKIGVIGSANFGLEDKQKDAKSFNKEKATIDYNHNSFELGIGYFTSIDRQANITFNIYGGVGFGSYEMNEKEDSSSYAKLYKAKNMKYFLQPSLNFFLGDYVRFGVYFKPSMVSYKSVETDYTEEEQDFFGFDELTDETLTFMEFGYALDVRVPGVPWLFLEHTLSYIPRPGDLNNTKLYPNSLGGTVGISVRLDQIGKGLKK